MVVTRRLVSSDADRNHPKLGNHREHSIFLIPVLVTSLSCAALLGCQRGEKSELKLAYVMAPGGPAHERGRRPRCRACLSDQGPKGKGTAA